MNLLPDIIKRLCLMYNDIAFWTSVAIVEVSHYAAFTNCKEKKPHKSHISIIQYHLFKQEAQLHRLLK